MQTLPLLPCHKAMAVFVLTTDDVLGVSIRSVAFLEGFIYDKGSFWMLQQSQLLMSVQHQSPV